MEEERWEELGGVAIPSSESLRRRFRWLESFTDDELRELNWCSARGELIPGEDYFDISRPERGAINVDLPTPVREGECCIPRSAVSERLWEKLMRLGS